MSSSLVDLNRISYMTVGGSKRTPVLNYLSSQYLNIKFLLTPKDSYLVTEADACNLPGIAHKVYGDKNYWWVIGLYNGIVFPEIDLVPGKVLQLPALTDINALLADQDGKTLTNVII